MNRYVKPPKRKNRRCFINKIGTYCCVCFIFPILTLVLAAGCSKSAPVSTAVDYTRPAAWAWWNAGDDQPADVFVIAPTVYFGHDRAFNMPFTDQESRRKFIGALNMQRGIFEKTGVRYAPFYRQVGLHAYSLEPSDALSNAFETAYADLRDAFTTFLAATPGRPLVLFGFSQGADMGLRLLKEFGSRADVQERLVAAYLIGWRVTLKDITEYPHLKMAEAERDLGVIISFNSEAPHIGHSLMVPEGVSTLSINPLNWRTDCTPADRALNLGACFVDYDGDILREEAMLTGATLDAVRGVLKVEDISPMEYPPGLRLFESGIYHLYDYQFFYRNLQDNIQKRVAAFLHSAQPEDD